MRAAASGATRLSAGRLVLVLLVLLVLLVTGMHDVEGKLTFRYHDFSEVQAYLKDVNMRYPNITHLYSIGRSVQRESCLSKATFNRIN